MKQMIPNPNLIYTHMNQLFVTIWWKRIQWNSTYPEHNGALYENLTDWAVFIGFAKPIFECSYTYYDGIVARRLTVFGLTIGCVSSWEAKPVV